jgi:CheY-like chemotaxis protein
VTSTAARWESDDSHAIPSSASPRERGAGLVLIVDDTADARDLYALYFRSRGFSVLTADDGEAAIATALEHRPDVIVMDLSMPRIDGLTATRHLKTDARTRDVPVILLTGYPVKAIQQGALDAGVARFLTKPCLPEDLEQHIERLIAR